MKHPIDHPRTRKDETRLEHFAELDRKSSGKPAAASEQAFRQPASRSEDSRLKRYTRIERSES
jgi:hypothetical protein